MSRIGKMPIPVPAGVDVKIDGKTITVKGPKGTLTRKINKIVDAQMADGVINITRQNEDKESKAIHGLTRALVNNMVVGVTDGFKKDLEINGVGYRAQKQGKQLIMNLGYSHQVIVDEIPGITIDVPAPNKITVSGADKQAVGQFAAEIRGKRIPDVYHGKGIKYAGEQLIHKEGKAGGKKS